ncbi:MAG TPA: alpha/beta hydrolase [Rhizomicrobium sp.]|jgi:4,5:9,10-diseco-3-hydroxy-5,9,17-trioxoandrosta-1(10),2-diene-4-oate hydrolase
MNHNDLSSPTIAALGAQAPVSFVEMGDARIGLMRRGRGQPIVCLHAIAHGARDFALLAEKVGDRFEIIAVDWPGHGLSPDDGQAPDAAHYANVLARLLDALQLENPILLGCSIGGAAALRVAAARPVGGLVLCNAGGLQAITPVTRFAIARMVWFFRGGEAGKKWFGGAYRFYYTRLVLPLAPPAHRERIIAAGYAMAPLLRQAWESFARADADTRALVAKVECPILFAWAKSDRIIAWSQSKRAAATAKNGTVALMRGGHAAFLEDADTFAAALRAFVRDKIAA